MAKTNRNTNPNKGAGRPDAGTRRPGRNHLLAIAIDAYRHCSPLNNAVRDVQTFIDLMQKRYQFEEANITFIKNEEATKKRIERAFIKLTRTIRPEDNLVVYFSGHGRYDPHLGGHWVPVEAGAGDDDWTDYLSNDLIKSYLALYPQGKYQAEAQSALDKLAEEQAWQRALAANTVRGFLDFEAGYPQSRWVTSGEVDRLIAEREEEDLWREATLSNSVTAYREYNRRTRLGKYRAQAVEAIKALLREKEEPAAWRQAQARNDRAAYDAYLTQFPNGAHAAEARTTLRDLRLEAERRDRERKEQQAREENRRRERSEAERRRKEEEERKEAQRAQRREQRAAFSRRFRSRRLRNGVLIGIALVVVIFGLWQGGLFETREGSMLLKAYEAPDGGFGYQDQEGNIIIPPEYKYGMDFADGLATVVLQSGDTITINERGECQSNCPEDREDGTQEEAKLVDDELPSPIQKLIADMVQVEGGTFTMGSDDLRGGDDECQHSVTVGSFKVGKFEVTQEQWRAVMRGDPPELNNKGCDKCPVEGVSWDDIQEFLQKLNAQTNLKFRLPTESEWEFAAKGGMKSKRYRYAGSNDIDKVAWYGRNTDSTRPVGQKAPNELGLYDKSGNVWEWCQDTYKSYPNCSGEVLSIRILRGGSWSSIVGMFSQEFCRSADRSGAEASGRFNNVGFRLAQD